MARWTIEGNGITAEVGSKDQLLAELRQLPSQADPNMDLVHNSGDRLSISVREGYALVRFTPGSQEPPYLSASMGTDYAGPDGEYFELLVGDTPTPVPTDRCIPFETMLAIAEHYYSQEELPEWIAWAED